MPTDTFAESLGRPARVAIGATSARQPAQLVSTALASDMDRLFTLARTRLMRLAQLNGATTDQAEDIVQETLLTAWRSLDQLRDPTRVDAWLDGICRNICRRVARQRARESARLVPLALSSTTSAATEQADQALPTSLDDIAAATTAATDPLEELSRQELVTLIESALGHLNRAAREAVSLRYLYDLPADETAARLGLSVNALEARLSRARKQLRAALNGPLRERALEFGLALAPADESGWRETSIWCHFCGRARMRGILAAAPDGSGQLTLRCPLCWRDYGITETDISSMPTLAGITSFRPALKRVLEHGVLWSASAQRLETICFHCGRPLPARMGRLADFPELDVRAPLFAQHYSAFFTCIPCGSFGSVDAALAGRAHPLVRRFLLERRRWVIEPDRFVDYQGTPAIRFTLFDRASGERIIYFSDPTTLAVRAVIDPSCAQ